jgi:hypothetical protein
MRGNHPGIGLLAAALLLGGSLVSLFSQAHAAKTFRPGQDQPVISEFRSSGPNPGYETLDDFVEIFNPSDHDVDLSGWYIQSISSSGLYRTLTQFLSGTIITPG